MLTYNIASALVCNKQNKILILKRSNKNKHFIGYWQLPEGKIENKESSENALLRELREELGFTPSGLKRLKKISIPLSIKNQKIRLNRTVYLVKYDGNIRLSRDHDGYDWAMPDDLEIKYSLVPGTKDVVSLL